MSINQNFPSVRPSLNLNFARSKKLDSRITFTRGSTGTYVDESGLIRTAGINEPRFDHDPTSLKSLGLLIEESRTNLFPTSEVFVSGWGGGGTANTDTILNPYGELGTVYYITTSERVREFNADGYSTLAFSFFSKKRFGGLERDYTRIEIFQVAVGDGNLGTYDFNFDGNNSDGTYFKDVKTEQYPNGWYRFSCRLVARADYNGGIFSTSTRIDLEGGATDNYIWGIQVEPASFATSYIPTTSASVTRSADFASLTGTNFSSWFNPTEGTTLISYDKYYQQTQFDIPLYPMLFVIGYWPTRIMYGDFGGVYQTMNVVISGSFQADLYDLSTRPTNTTLKFIGTYKENDFATIGTMRVLYTDTSGSIPTGLTSATIGNESLGSSTLLNGHIEKIAYYPKRLTNTQLQNLTK